MFDFEPTDEQKLLIETARRFAREEIMPVAAKCDHEGKFPAGVMEKAHELGLVNIEIPEAFGGLGLGCAENCLVIEEMAYGCAGIAVPMAVNTLASAPVFIAGTEAQKKRYLGELTDSPCFAAYAITEPGAGSDVVAMRTSVRKDGNHYILNGQKTFITNASWSRWLVVFATLDRSHKHKGICAFVVPRDTPGLSIGKKEDKLGQRASDTADVILEDVRLGPEHLLGQEGEGFRIAMKTFDRTRPWIGALATGIMRRCLDECVAYAKERVTFGQPIGAHQAVQFMLAEMAIKIEATSLLTKRAAWQVDRGNPVSIDSSLAKAFGADSAMAVATDAVQVFGGYGYSREYPVEKLMRDAKLLQIYEGTSQIQRMVIGRHLLK
jgi:acyl-CoA dehydrogenase